MAEKETNKQITEAQLTQMARQEENSLLDKQAMLERISAVLNETITAKETLKEMQKSNGKILVSIGATVLIEAEAKEVKKCKRGFAENAYKEENTAETIEWLGKKEEQLKTQLTKLGQDYSETKQRFTSLVGVLKQIDSEKRKINEKIKQQPLIISK